MSNKIVLFGFTYLLIFSASYAFIFYDKDALLIIWMLLTMLNLPSLLCVILMVFIAVKRNSSFSKYMYFIVSFIVFVSTFLIFDYLTYDPRNIFPIFQKTTKLIFFLMCFTAHLSAYGFVLLTDTFKKA